MGQLQGIQGMVIPFAIFMVIFYFLLIRPQKKREKAHNDMLAKITRGSVVITAGGFYGKVCEVLEDSYIIDLGDASADQTVKVRILKSSIAVMKEAGDSRPKKRKKKVKEVAETQQDVAAVSAEVTEAAETATKAATTESAE